MDETEPFDWSPEIDLLKGFDPRVGAVVGYWQASRKRASARRSMFARAVMDDSALLPGDLAARLSADPEFAALFEVALDASMRSAHERKLRLLARVVAQAATDTASIDDAQLIEATIRDLEPPHMRALTVLDAYKEENPDAAGVASVIESMGRLRGSGPEKVTGSSRILRARLPASPDVADAISAALERQGIIWNDPPGFGNWGITDYGQRILDLLRGSDTTMA